MRTGNEAGWGVAVVVHRIPGGEARVPLAHPRVVLAQTLRLRTVVAVISAIATAIAILPLLLPTADSPAVATWHVSPTGSDRANGTPTAPFLTITKAVNTARSGDTVRVADGVYRESVQVYRKSLDIVGASQTGTVLDGTNGVEN